ncbi:MAG: DEAD/DEAH box helicase family protein [Actinomycetota bacterium]|nr:DEAD/DEAH box helicase family protein [Actinomycetota bacterium]
MRFDLIDYQRHAALGVLQNLSRGREDWNRHKSLSSFALSAVTGAGKTVIATAVIEAMIHGSSDLDVESDPRATFLWVTDDPALNRQTRNKMLEASDLLAPARLVILNNDFLNAELSPGRVYFLNVQKLSKSSGLAQGGNNLRQHSMWDILTNTINGEGTDLYLVLDEAHRGMRRIADRKTIVQRIISGDGESNPPAPVVWGISATIERYLRAMEGVTNRTSYPFVQVDIEKVRESGLIKDEIGVDEPDEKGTFSTTLLRDAVSATKDYESRWAAYAAAQDEPVVVPALVVQVPDKVSASALTDLLGVIESEWPRLPPDAVAHVFGEHEALRLGDRLVRWVHPESIQGDPDIRVVLAKEAISTGWDCPRAEVLYSERPAKDATHIAQIIGRMVRQPLARRIPTDDTLNSVMCFLPRFDRDALSTIKDELEGRGKDNGDQRVGADVVRRPRVFERNPNIEAEAFNLIESLPSIPAPDALASPLRRAKALARLLTDDAGGTPLLANAGEELTQSLNARLDGLAAEYQDEVSKNVEDIVTLRVHQSRLSTTGGEATTTSRVTTTHVQDVDRDTKKIIRAVKEGVGQDYLAYRVHKAGAESNKFDVRTEVAALFMVENVSRELEDAATKWVRDRLEQFAVEIKNTTGASKAAYLKVQEQASKAEPTTITLRDNLLAPTCDSKGNALPEFQSHVYSDENGLFPIKLNDWETHVIQTEIGRPSFVGWYRNPSRASPAALRIAYQDESNNWTSLQVDFLVASRRNDGSLGVSIVDPHGDHLADANAKLKALADYAEQYQDRYVRIESIAEGADGSLRVLDLREPKVREAVRGFTGGKVSALYESPASLPFK